MKKTTKYIIITLVVLIVLGAAAAALILTSPKDSEDDANSSSTVSESTEPALIDKTAEDVKNIGIEDLTADDSYTIIPTETTTSSGDTEQTFTIEGWDDLDVLYSNVKSLADRLYSITPTKKVGAVEDLSEYGLGSGEGYKITMNYTDGTSQTFTIGNKAGESSGSYMLYEDEVYIVPVSTYLKQSKYDFLNKSLIAIPTPTITATDGTETDSTSEINSLHLSGQNYPEEIQFGLSDDEVLAYDITEPIYAGMNSGKIDDFVKQLQNVTAAGVLAVHATEEDIAKYGLDNPVAVCDYTMNDEHHVIKLGDKTGDLYSMMVDDDTTIYTITDSAVTFPARRLCAPAVHQERFPRDPHLVHRYGCLRRDPHRERGEIHRDEHILRSGSLEGRQGNQLRLLPAVLPDAACRFRFERGDSGTAG